MRQRFFFRVASVASRRVTAGVCLAGLLASGACGSTSNDDVVAIVPQDGGNGAFLDGSSCAEDAGDQIGCPCQPGQTRSCYGGPPGTEGVGSCKAGTQTCVQSGELAFAYGACTGQVLPSAGDDCKSSADAGSGGGDACAANLQTDPANCGECGHSCCGAACNGGVCQAGPATLASAPNGPSSALVVAVDGTSVYWSDSAGTVEKIPKTGGVASVFATLPAPPANHLPNTVNAFGFDASTVYMATTYGLMSTPKAGGAVTVLHAADVGGGARDVAVAVDNASVYWLEVATNAGDTATDALMKMPKTGGPATMLATFSTDGGVSGLTPLYMAIDSTSVYWSASAPWAQPPATSAPGQTMSVVQKLALGGGSPQTLFTGEPTQLLLDGPTIWLDLENASAQGWSQGPGSLRTMGLSGGPTTTVEDPFPPTGVAAASIVAVDATAVYWEIPDSAQNGRIMKLPKTGGPSIQLATGPSPFDATADDQCLYWSTFPATSTSPVYVMAVAK